MYCSNCSRNCLLKVLPTYAFRHQLSLPFKQIIGREFHSRNYTRYVRPPHMSRTNLKKKKKKTENYSTQMEPIKEKTKAKVPKFSQWICKGASVPCNYNGKK